MPEPEDENSVGWKVEEVVIESCLVHCRTENVFHYHNDATSDWPIVSVRATLQGDDLSEIKVNGQKVQVFNVFVVAEWPVTAVVGGEKVSASELDLLSAEINAAILDMGNTQAMDLFTSFWLEPLTEGEKDFEDDEQSTPTRRVDIASFTCLVIPA